MERGRIGVETHPLPSRHLVDLQPSRGPIVGRFLVDYGGRHRAEKTCARNMRPVRTGDVPVAWVGQTNPADGARPPDVVGRAAVDEDFAGVAEAVEGGSSEPLSLREERGCSMIVFAVSSERKESTILNEPESSDFGSERGDVRGMTCQSIR